jgi:hypothetical protein
MGKRLGDAYTSKVELLFKQTYVDEPIVLPSGVKARLTLKVRHFRVEFVNETPEQVMQSVTKYRQFLRGEIAGAELWRER